MLKFFPPSFGLYAAGVMIVLWIAALILKRYNFKLIQIICRVLSAAAMVYLIVGVYTVMGPPYSDAGVRYSPSGVSEATVKNVMDGMSDLHELPAIRDSELYHVKRNADGVEKFVREEYRVLFIEGDIRVNVELTEFADIEAARNYYTSGYTKASEYINDSEKDKLGFLMVSGADYEACVLPVGYDAKRFVFGDLTSDDGTIFRVFIRLGSYVAEITENTDSYTVAPVTDGLFTSSEELARDITTEPSAPVREG
ncbi:MAG: hypothetical protein K6C36_08955 [Clostridia bacterium]|nr:hypothetical protein [Clostridia bacterium]